MGKSRSRKRRARSTQGGGGGGAPNAESLVILKKPKIQEEEDFFIDIEGCERTRSRVARKKAANAVLGPDESSTPSSSSTSAKHPLSLTSKHSRTTKRRSASKKRATSRKKKADAVKVEPGAESVDSLPETVEDLDIWSSAADEAQKKSLPKASVRAFTVELEPKQRKLRQSKRIAKVLHKNRSSNFTPSLPLPGASVNPTPEDHQAALKAASEYLAAQSRSEDAAKSRMKDAVRRTRKQQQENGSDDEDDSEDEDSEDETTSASGVSRAATNTNNRITRVKKNKRARHRAMLQEHEKRKRAKEHRKELDRLKDIAESVETEVKEHREEVEEREKARAEAAEKPSTGRFGKHRYQPVFPEVLLSEDLTDNLRSLKPSGDAFMDIQNALERRNLVEVRKKTRIRPRYKKKFYTMKQDTHWGRGGADFRENQKKRQRLDKKLSK